MSKHIEMEEKQMHGFRARLGYQLKHNDTFYRFFNHSEFWNEGDRFLCAHRQKMILFSAHSRKFR